MNLMLYGGLKMSENKKKSNKDLIIETKTALELLRERTKLIETYMDKAHPSDLRSFIATLSKEELTYWEKNHPTFQTMITNELNWRDDTK